MSSDSISYVQNPDTARLQGLQTVARPGPEQQQEQLQKVSREVSLQRQGSAAGGQGLPSTQEPTDDTRPEKAQVESAVSQISDFVQNFQRDLLFSIDEESDRLVVKVVDSETQEVIRQIPSEESLRIAKHLDSADSLILREQA
jgi:flagellar protein FlaG